MTASKLVLNASSGVGGAGLDVDEVFNTFLYEATGDTSYNAGNGSDNAINNGIDLSGEGGLVWIKSREHSNPVGNYDTGHFLYDTVRGAGKYIRTNRTNGQATASDSLKSFNSNGFTLGKDSDSQGVNYQNRISGEDHVSFTFRKAKKFFDIVTYTGNATAGRTVSHNLGSVPGMIIVKCTSEAQHWAVYHRSQGATKYALLSNTDAFSTYAGTWNDTEPTSTEITLGVDGWVNRNGRTYVAYLFAHNNNDGGFGPDGDQDIIKCGGYTGNGSSTGPVINLGFEPQFVMIKSASAGGSDNDWYVVDTMRRFEALPQHDAGSQFLKWNTSDNEPSSGQAQRVAVNSTGFSPIGNSTGWNINNQNYIYMAIRKGPLFVPEDATKVFNVNTYSNNSNSNIYNTGFDVDMSLSTNRDGNNNFIKARMTGTKYLQTNATAAEGATTTAKWFNSKSNSLDLATNWWGSNNAVSWAWRRAPSYFDVVCYTGNSTSNTEIKHNLGAVPEMVWTKRRSGTRNWVVYHTALGINNTMWLNEDSQADDESAGMHATPTATSLFLKGNNYTNLSGATHIAYLFATVAGVSKVGSYTGNGSSQNIDCGFSSGARFVLIKRTDVSEGWKVHDSVRGIVAGNDPFIELNNNNAENSSFDLLDPYSGGFAVNNFYGWNGSGGSYIFYAIA